MAKCHRTYQYRAYTSRAGYERIAEVLRESARLYNAALEEWRWAYRAGVSVSLYSQYRELTAIRAEDEFWGGVSIQVSRGVLRRADRARQAFYRRVKAVWAGRELVVVDSKFTSQRCSGCGVVSSDHRQRKRYNCAECGMTEDADINAARNILDSALAGRRWPNIRLHAAS